MERVLISERVFIRPELGPEIMALLWPICFSGSAGLQNSWTCCTERRRLAWPPIALGCMRPEQGGKVSVCELSHSHQQGSQRLHIFARYRAFESCVWTVQGSEWVVLAIRIVTCHLPGKTRLEGARLVAAAGVTWSAEFQGSAYSPRRCARSKVYLSSTSLFSFTPDSPRGLLQLRHNKQ